MGVPDAAEQVLTVVPPFIPLKLHVQGTLPLTADAVPALHKRFALGAAVTTLPFAGPQTPFTGEVEDPVVKDWLTGKDMPVLFIAKARY